MKRAIAGFIAGIVLLFAGAVPRVSAQKPQGLDGLVHRTDFFFGVTGVFPETAHTGELTNSASKSAGAVGALRFHFNSWNALEVRYSFTRNTQSFFLQNTPFLKNYSTSVPTNVHELTFDYVRTLAHAGKLTPFVLIGGGALFFNAAQDNESLANSLAYETWGTDFDESQTRGAMVYGGGIDYKIASHLLFRAEYRGLLYKIPAQNVASGWGHMAEPAVGMVVQF